MVVSFTKYLFYYQLIDDAFMLSVNEYFKPVITQQPD